MSHTCDLPSREQNNIPSEEKEHHRLKNALLVGAGGYVIVPQEGNKNQLKPPPIPIGSMGLVY